MIIVNQERDQIFNFDNVETLYIYQQYILQDDEKEIFIKCIATDGLDVDLGTYKTKERAYEVIQEIIKSYRDYRTAECDGYTNVLQKTAVFEMPED